jgi:hypothetical protein
VPVAARIAFTTKAAVVPALQASSHAATFNLNKNLTPPNYLETILDRRLQIRPKNAGYDQQDDFVLRVRLPRSRKPLSHPRLSRFISFARAAFSGIVLQVACY